MFHLASYTKLQNAHIGGVQSTSIQSLRNVVVIVKDPCMFIVENSENFFFFSKKKKGIV